MHRSILIRILIVAALALGVLCADASFAGLGQPVDSIATDKTALHATTLAVTPTQSYDVNDITMPGGAHVREYATRSGTVFAVAWSGRQMPDLSIVLGPYYADYLQAARHHANHKVVTIATGRLVLHIMKLPRGFSGSAYVPVLMPAGTTPEDVR